MQQRHIHTLLIANRSEIAARIQLTAQQLGIRTVCVYTAEDATAPHLAYADAIYPLPLSGAAGYLDQATLIAIAHEAGANAIHPGYGFLAENSFFAQRVVDAGLIWVGPAPIVIAAMGDKARAREQASQLGIPVVPGAAFNTQNAPAAEQYAALIGYPVLLKAALGGGGKGMRRVEEAATFSTAWAEVTRIGKHLFGDSTVVVEKYITAPRHIEVQIVGDGQTTLHLFDRECSVQRNNQKIIEEAPATNLSPELRSRLWLDAVTLAQNLRYTTVGTVEFIVTADGRYYFLEMNTRLQVEHAVTEKVTGLDLVALQLMVAQGGHLSLTQESIVCHGHAIECRIYCERPENNFLPATGTIALYSYREHPQARYDHSIRTPHKVTPLFDPMLSKITTHASTRSIAIASMQLLLADYTIVGVQTNRDFLRHILAQPAFVAATLHTQSMPHLLANFTSPISSTTTLPLAHAGAIANILTLTRTLPHTPQTQHSWRGNRWK